MDLAAPLAALMESSRFWHLDKLDRYYRDQQDSTKRYDWDGTFLASGDLSPYSTLAPGYYVPYSQRRPSTRYRLARVVVSVLTEMSMAGCEIKIEGDEAAEAAARAYVASARLLEQMAQVRNYGGAQGTGCASLEISEGRFRVDVHNPKHVRVTQWRDRSEFVPAEVIKAYRFERDVFDTSARKNITKVFWYVRIWTVESERIWEAIPDEIAADPDWSRVAPDFESAHGFGFCPFYWVQNVPDCEEEDGEGDYEGSTEKLDEINRLASATTRGTQRNVDPTLVVRDEDDGSQITKGSGGVIFSRSGAEYLELKGLAVATATAWLSELRSQVFDESGVVMPSEEKLAGAAQSASAMRILYRRMIAKCDVLRDQYGIMVTRIVSDMLRIAGDFRAAEPETVTAPDGSTSRRIKVLTPDLDPGNAGAQVSLFWGPYFLPTHNDIKAAIDTAKAAAGGKAVMSQRSAIQFIAPLVGIEDADQELEAIQEQADADAERMKDTFRDPELSDLPKPALEPDDDDDPPSNGKGKREPFEGGKPAPG